MATATRENAGANRLGLRRRSGRKTVHDNGGFVPRNSIPIKHLSFRREFDPPTDSPDEAEKENR